VVVDAVLQTNTNEAAISTARQGWGLTRVLAYQVAADLQAGRLQRVMREFEEPPLPIHVLYPEGRRSPAKVRAFIDLAVSRLRAHPAFL
jgi:DNA-binding transcriptional LysR family regulator